jgi:hypothetical protein
VILRIEQSHAHVGEVILDGSGEKIGDQHGIEKMTQVWDKTVVDRTQDLSNWVGLFRQFVQRGLKIFAYANITRDTGRRQFRRFGNCGRSQR